MFTHTRIYIVRDGQPTLDVRPHFLGLISSVAIREEQGQIDFVPIPTNYVPIVKVQQMLDLGIVIKARTVVEAITYHLTRPYQLIFTCRLLPEEENSHSF